MYNVKMNMFGFNNMLNPFNSIFTINSFASHNIASKLPNPLPTLILENPLKDYFDQHRPIISLSRGLPILKFDNQLSLNHTINQTISLSKSSLISEIAKRFTPFIDLHSVIQAVHGSSSVLGRAVSDINNNFNTKINHRLIKYGWVVPDNVEITFVVQLINSFKDIEYSEDEERKLIDKWFVEYFSSNNWKEISSFAKNWEVKERIKAERFEIINHCLDLVKSKSSKSSCNIVIPTLIAQLEGLLCDKLNSGNEMKKEDMRKFIEQQSTEIFAVELVIVLLFDKLFAHTRRNPPNPLENNAFVRNKILHGEWTHYGCIENVIKLFLLIEIIAGMNNRSILEV